MKSIALITDQKSIHGLLLLCELLMRERPLEAKNMSIIVIDSNVIIERLMREDGYEDYMEKLVGQLEERNKKSKPSRHSSKSDYRKQLLDAAAKGRDSGYHDKEYHGINAMLLCFLGVMGASVDRRPEGVVTLEEAVGRTKDSIIYVDNQCKILSAEKYFAHYYYHCLYIKCTTPRLELSKITKEELMSFLERSRSTVSSENMEYVILDQSADQEHLILCTGRLYIELQRCVKGTIDCISKAKQSINEIIQSAHHCGTGRLSSLDDVEIIKFAHLIYKTKAQENPHFTTINGKECLLLGNSEGTLSDSCGHFPDNFGTIVADTVSYIDDVFPCKKSKILPHKKIDKPSIRDGHSSAIYAMRLRTKKAIVEILACIEPSALAEIIYKKCRNHEPLTERPLPTILLAGATAHSDGGKTTLVDCTTTLPTLPPREKKCNHEPLTERPLPTIPLAGATAHSDCDKTAPADCVVTSPTLPPRKKIVHKASAHGGSSRQSSSKAHKPDKIVKKCQSAENVYYNIVDEPRRTLNIADRIKLRMTSRRSKSPIIKGAGQDARGTYKAYEPIYETLGPGPTLLLPCFSPRASDGTTDSNVMIALPGSALATESIEMLDIGRSAPIRNPGIQNDSLVTVEIGTTRDIETQTSMEFKLPVSAEDGQQDNTQTFCCCVCLCMLIAKLMSYISTMVSSPPRTELENSYAQCNASEVECLAPRNGAW